MSLSLFFCSDESDAWKHAGFDAVEAACALKRSSRWKVQHHSGYTSWVLLQMLSVVLPFEASLRPNVRWWHSWSLPVNNLCRESVIYLPCPPNIKRFIEYRFAGIGSTYTFGHSISPSQEICESDMLFGRFGADRKSHKCDVSLRLISRTHNGTQWEPSSMKFLFYFAHFEREFLVMSMNKKWYWNVYFRLIPYINPRSLQWKETIDSS